MDNKFSLGRLLFIVLAGFVLASLLAGGSCSGGGSNTNDDGGGGEPQKTIVQDGLTPGLTYEISEDGVVTGYVTAGSDGTAEFSADSDSAELNPAN